MRAVTILMLRLGLAPLAFARSTKAERIAEVLEAERNRLHVPGLAAVVLEGDQIILLEGFGRRDLEHRLPVTPDTVFPIGSATKSFTAVATG